MPSAPVPVRSTAPWRGRRIVLLGVVLVALNLRIAVASVSPILDLVREDVALSATEAGLLGTIPVISFAAFGSLTPVLARRLGLEPLLVLAMLLSVTGEVVRSGTSTATGFLGWTVIALAGMGMGNVLLPPVVKRYFPDRIGVVTSVYSVTMSVSTALPALLAVPVAERLGWRVSLSVWSVVGVLAAVPWVVVVVRSAAARAELAGVLRRSPTTTPALTSRHRSGGRVWRSPLAWGMGVTFAMNSLNVYAMFAWLPQILIDDGTSPHAAGTWLSVYAILSLPPALVAPIAAARMRNPIGLIVFFVACFVASYVGLLVSPDGPLWLWIVLGGLGPGAFPVLLALINLRTRTSAGAASLSGFTQGVGYAIAGTGPLLIGVLYDATGGWTAALLFLIGTLVVLLAAATVACRPVMLEDTWGPRGSTPPA
ncbi:MFS transporter [Cellulomonas hominis]|uniref:MFS transporter n=1 Tax=Cellulomonas hominis TaxID=156981 RepID=UPI001B95A74B|nr:MFS transporter [Cellulomonas hominis]VTR77570.1 putative transporter YycB [Cellulomonas hominis]